MSSLSVGQTIIPHFFSMWALAIWSGEQELIRTDHKSPGNEEDGLGAWWFLLGLASEREGLGEEWVDLESQKLVAHLVLATEF